MYIYDHKILRKIAEVFFKKDVQVHQPPWQPWQKNRRFSALFGLKTQLF